MRNRLYKITAHCGSRTHTYYVVATGTTAAEEGVSRMHKDNQWSAVDSFDSETVAEEYTYGKPVPLILANVKDHGSLPGASVASKGCAE